MQSLHDIPAPAKLNLFLHITGRRTDGYHLLQSVFMLIDWADTLHVERRDQGRLSREDLLAPLPADDLILQAARALQAVTGTPHGAHIAVEKRLPAQAGLGGGSSDAASTLLALNRLWQLGLSLEQLCVIGLQLGADVPFFLRGHNAWVEGIGESITPVELPRRHVLVVKPQAGLETRAIFSDPALKRDSIPATISGFAADPQA
ncbi:MAG: 4-(cytidine 5'-diphospho)-2-C-methyl-D-erythritol kinase, partial [Hylemonella sp.]